jgi:DMSO/TMAO reductase YedYZ heme-binding membrane subunit
VHCRSAFIEAPDKRLKLAAGAVAFFLLLPSMVFSNIVFSNSVGSLSR